MTFSVAPGVLIAMPSLMDPNFYRSVVLLCAHNEDGAFGLVLNRTMEVPVSAVCADAGIDWEGGSDLLVYDGGPVDKQRGWLLHDEKTPLEGSQSIAEGIGMTTSHSGLETYGRDSDGPYKLMVGYAGWSVGQLDQEIAAGAWLTAPATIELIFCTATDQIWRAALASVGVNPANLVEPGVQLN